MAHGKNWRTFPGYLPNWILRLVDPYAHAITVIQEEHRMAHDGMMFNATGKIAGLANGATQELLMTTGASYPHMSRMTINVGAGDVDIVTHRDPTTSAAGTAIPGNNTNENSSNTAVLTLTHTPTVSADGDEIHRGWAPPTSSGVGQSASGLSNLNQGEEWIMKPNTKYLVRITNNSGGEISLSFDILWYEVSYVNE